MDEFVVFGVLLAALVLFITGKVRYDIVAISALLILTIVQIVPAADAFQGLRRCPGWSPCCPRS